MEKVTVLNVNNSGFEFIGGTTVIAIRNGNSVGQFKLNVRPTSTEQVVEWLTEEMQDLGYNTLTVSVG